MRMMAVLLDQGCMLIIPSHASRFYPTVESLEQDKTFLQCPGGTLDIFFDTSSQIYRRETIPRKMTRKNWLAERLKVDDPESHWVGYLQQGPTTYLFIDLRLSSSQRRWVEFFKSIPRSIKFVRLMPLEMASLALGMKKSCAVITYASAFLGLRQVVFYQGHFLLTRLVPIQDEDFEKEQLLTYLHKEYEIERDDVAFMPVPFPFIPQHRKPVLSVHLKILASSRREAYCRKILMWLSMCCIFLVIILSFYLEHQRDVTRRACAEDNHASPFVPLQPIEKEKAILWDRYRHLKEIMPDPLRLFEQLSLWLFDHWIVRAIVWHGPPQETILLHLDYGGPFHEKKEALKDQMQKSFSPYTTALFGDVDGIQFTLS